MSVWEMVAGLCHGYLFHPEAERHWVRLFLEELSIRFVAMDEAAFEIAADAYARFGKGRHPAGLNMGDCFAYAVARAQGARLLFKGGDFGRTDIDVALVGRC